MGLVFSVGIAQFHTKVVREHETQLPGIEDVVRGIIQAVRDGVLLEFSGTVSQARAHIGTGEALMVEVVVIVDANLQHLRPCVVIATVLVGGIVRPGHQGPAGDRDGQLEAHSVAQSIVQEAAVTKVTHGVGHGELAPEGQVLGLQEGASLDRQDHARNHGKRFENFHLHLLDGSPRGGKVKCRLLGEGDNGAENDYERKKVSSLP